MCLKKFSDNLQITYIPEIELNIYKEQHAIISERKENYQNKTLGNWKEVTILYIIN